jgi:hypothetical protein
MQIYIKLKMKCITLLKARHTKILKWKEAQLSL